MSIDHILAQLDRSHSPFHAVKECVKDLKKAGFIEWKETFPISFEAEKSYFVMRNQSSLIAFRIPISPKPQFKLVSAHSDSPTFKLKPNPDLPGNPLRWNVEPYGGMIMSTWLDRPLSIAGRVMVRTEKGIETRLLDIDSDLLTIPNVAIHMNREINKGYSWNPAVDLIPVVGNPKNYDGFHSFLKTSLNDPTVLDVISHDLFLYTRENARLVGLEKDLVSSPRLDDLSSAYTALNGFLNAKGTDAIDVFALFDNEEVGSLTRQGADSTFLRDVLKRVSADLFKDVSTRKVALARSINLSVDNAHANHPNHPELSDKTTAITLNGGIVLKYNAAQKYTTDAFASAIVKEIAQLAHTSVQEYTNRSDLPGGSTLGNISNAQTSLISADIGLPQLAMHSAVELCGREDIESMIRFIQTYFDASIDVGGSSVTIQ